MQAISQRYVCIMYYLCCVETLALYALFHREGTDENVYHDVFDYPAL